jgi:RNA polymerase sigma factor (sigma-70 family)
MRAAAININYPKPVHKSGPKGRSIPAADFYSFPSVTNSRAIDLLRRRRRRESFGQEAATGKVLAFRSAETRTPEDVLLDKERQHYAALALAQLSERDRDCLTLRRSGLSYREVAEVLQINPNKVEAQSRPALRPLHSTDGEVQHPLQLRS